MNTKEIFGKALGIVEPWYVVGVNLQSRLSANYKRTGSLLYRYFSKETSHYQGKREYQATNEC